MVLKFSQQTKHAQRTEKYIRLIFNSYISDDYFFQKYMRSIDTNYFFLEIFKAKRGCALCTNAHYATLNTVIVFGHCGYFEYSVIPVVIKSYVLLVMKCQLICYVMVQLFFELYRHIWLLVLVNL